MCCGLRSEVSPGAYDDRVLLQVITFPFHFFFFLKQVYTLELVLKLANISYYDHNLLTSSQIHFHLMFVSLTQHA